MTNPPPAHIIATGDILAGDVGNLIQATERIYKMALSMGPDQWDDPRLSEDWNVARGCLQRALWQVKAARQALLNHGEPAKPEEPL